MHSAKPHNQPGESADDVNQTQQQNEKDVQTETDSAFFVSLLQGIAAIGFIPLSDRAKVVQAFSALKDKNFKERILKVGNPEELREIQNSHSLVVKEIKRQKKDWREGESIEVGVGRFRRKISFDEYTRISQAVEIASATQSVIGNQENAIRRQNTVDVFGLNPENQAKLSSGFDDWKKKYPNGSYDNYLHHQGNILYQEQQKTITGKAPGDIKDRSTQLTKKNESARLQAVKDNAQLIIRQHEVVEKILDPKSPKVASDEELRKLWQYIEKGTLPERTPEQPLETAPAVQKAPEYDLGELAKGPGEGAFFDDIMGYPPESKPAPIQTALEQQQATLPASNPLASLYSRILQKIPKMPSFLPKSISTSLTNNLTKLTGLFKGGLGGLFKSGLGSLAKSALIKAGLGALTGGVGTALSFAADGLKKLTGIDVVGVGKKAVLGLAAIVILPVFLILYLVLFDKPSKGIIPTLPGETTQSLMPVKQNLSWKTFEKNFLEAKSFRNQQFNIDWFSFEDQYLNPQKKFLSLDQ